MRFAGDRDDFIACRGLLRRLLGQYTHREPSAIEFAYGRHGKPELAGPGIDGPLHFNASHSGGLALYAVTALCPVGVDVERVRMIPNVEQLAAQFLAASEANNVTALPRPQRIEKFFTCWTLKEAYLKATGEGIGGGLRAERPSGWHVDPLSPAAGYIGSIAYAHDAARLVCWQVPLQP
jgi:4'-phosphopantetheinyl transferase